MKFGFRHGPLQSKQQSVVKVAGVVDSVLIQNERVGEGADFQEPVPVGGIACQARNFQAEHDAGLPQTYLRHQLLKSFAVRGFRGGVAEIGVDDRDPFDWPAQGYGTLAKIILSYRALGVLKHLAQSGLPDIQISVSLQMAGGYLFMSRSCHKLPPVED